MYRGSDSVFRLSLIGIAFIFIFFLLIVFGVMYSNTELSLKEATEQLEQHQRKDARAFEGEAFESARQTLQARLAEAGVNADEVVRGLIDKTQSDAEVATLKQRVQELNVKLAGLEQFKVMLEQARQSTTLNGMSMEALLSALELRARIEQKITASEHAASEVRLSDNEIASRTLAAVEFRQQIGTLLERELGGQAIAPGQEATWVQWLVDAQMLKSPGRGGSGDGSRSTAGGDNRTLRDQIAFLRARLETFNDNIIPPCWFDEKGGVQFLLTIEFRPNTVVGAPVWPNTRAADARAIPGLGRLISRSPVTYENFYGAAEAIVRHGGNQCHYSLRVKDNVRSGMRSERILQKLETLFHLAWLR
ncbi:MAG: hypothetical protein LBU45_05055 [Azoarcus sp.]|jgi:hypothetical protein|nr:hypothetical protein [Azoarcus sp.]